MHQLGRLKLCMKSQRISFILHLMGIPYIENIGAQWVESGWGDFLAGGAGSVQDMPRLFTK